MGAFAVMLRLDGEINHHDGVFLHDADEHDEADEAIDVQIQMKSISVSSAPKPADGRPDKMVSGWMKLS